MRFALTILAALSALSLGAGRGGAQEIATTSLRVGDIAPDFKLLSDEWKTVSLSDYLGKKNVVLAFYVLAFTGG